MKKFLSVLLAILVVLPCFGITSFAIGGYAEFEKDGIYYFEYYDDEVYVAGYNPFYFDENKTEIVIPETVKNGFRNTYTVVGIDYDAFAQSGFTKITLPDTITDIGSGAFFGSVDLREVVIPETCHFDYFGTDVFTHTMAEEKLFKGTDTAIIGDNVLYAYIGNEKIYVIDESIDFIADKCFMFSGIESITIGENITEIPMVAFAGCRNLTSVTIPANVYYVSDGAFKDCTSLSEVIIEEGVGYLGAQCFSNTAIKTIHLPASMNEISGAFMDCKTLESVTVDEENETLYAEENAIYEYWEYVYEDWDGNDVVESENILVYYFPSKAEKVINIPAGVTDIGDYAFYGLSEVEEVYADEISSVGMKAFCGTNLRVFDTEGEYAVYENAFSGCAKLEEINLENVWYIGTGAFQNCTSLKNVTLSDELYVLDGLAFANTGIEEITVKGEDIWVGEGAFKDCQNLKKVVLGEGVYYVSLNTFLNCPGLETVYLSKTIDFFEDNALSGCENVKFEVIKNTDGHREVEKLGYDFEIVGKLTFMEEISNFFDRIIDFLFGWIFSI